MAMGLKGLAMRLRPKAQKAPPPADRPWQATARGLWLCLAVMGAAASAAGQTATNSSGLPADPATPASLGAGSRVLDRALTGALSTGDGNLDLLLDAQRKLPGALDETPGGKMPPRSSASRAPPAVLTEPARPADTATPAARPSADRLPPPAAPGQVLDLPAQGGNPGARRHWSAGPAGHGGEGGFGMDPSALIKSDPQLRDLVQRSMRFVKDNIIEFLAGVLLVVALAAGLKAYSRRPD